MIYESNRYLLTKLLPLTDSTMLALKIFTSAAWVSTFMASFATSLAAANERHSLSRRLPSDLASVQHVITQLEFGVEQALQDLGAFCVHILEP